MDDRQTARGRETSGAALVSVVSNSALTLSKLLVGLATGSISVVSEGVHSGNDLVAALLAYFSVRKANQPADERHTYGHGKFEALSGVIEALLIMVAAVAIAYTAIRSLLLGQRGEVEHGPALAVMAFSTAVNVVVSTHLYRVARRHDSLALKADAAHLRADVWTSAGVFLGLGAMYLVEMADREAHWLDPALAMMVALLILMQGTRITREGLNQLLDRSLPEDEVKQIAERIEEHAGAFVEFHKLRSRRAGHERHIDLHLVVKDDLTVAQAHDIADHLEQDIAALYPGSQVMIHVEPGSRSRRRKPTDP